MIFYWQVTIYAPSNADLFSFLVVAPAVLFLFVIVVNKVSQYILQPKVQNEATESVAESASPQLSNSSITTGREWFLPLIFGQIVTLHGESVGDLASAIDEKTTKFALDTELVDAEGFPLMTARIADLDVEKTFEDFEAWATKYKPTDAKDVSWLTEDKRTLHLQYVVFTKLLREVLSNDHIAELLVNYLANSKLPIPNIYLVSSVPKHWLPIKKMLLNDWFMSEITRQNWPEYRVLNSPLQHDGLNAWQTLDAINELIHQSNKLGIYLVTAAQSYLGERTLSEYEAAGKLLTAQNKTGSVYGEAAAGVVAVDEQLATQFEESSIVQLHRAASRQRDKSADAAGKVSPAILIDVMKDALSVAKVGAENVNTVAGDADSRVSRATEFFSAVSEVFPEIDAERNVLKLQEVCGMVGVAAGLASLIYAMDKVASDEAPVLWVSSTDSFDRCALVLNLPKKPNWNRVNLHDNKVN